MGNNNHRPISSEDLIQEFIRANRADMSIAMPAKIMAFDAETQTAKVEFQIRKKLHDGKVLKPVQLGDVPVQIFRAGGFAITVPIKAGDGCLLLFAQRDITNWQKEGGPAEPASNRMNDISDAIAIVGLNSERDAVPDYNTENLEIRNEAKTATIEVTPEGKIIMTATEGIEMNGIDFEDHVHGAGLLLDGNGVPVTGKTGSAESLAP